MNKKNGKNLGGILSGLEKLLDYTLNFLVGFVCYLFTRLRYYNEFTLGQSRAVLILCFGALVLFFLYSYYDLYTPMRTRKPTFFISRIFLVHIEVTALLLSALFIFSDKTAMPYLFWTISSQAISLFVILAKKVTMISFLYSLRAKKRNIKHILLVTDSQEMADAYMEEITANPHFGYSVIGYVGNLNVIGLTHLGTTGDLDRILKEYSPDEVVLALDTVRKKLITKYITICNNNCAKTFVVPAICGYFRSQRQVTELGNLPLIDIRSTPLDRKTNRALKRTLDIIGALILIIVTSPLMLFTAIGVKLSSPGPIFFRQIRVGRNNREFLMYKFRSMRVNDSEQTGWSTENDPRKTRFGTFIRKFALDELPQFFNVLKGDMSLVGPRPEVPFYVEKFRKEVPLYMLKHTVRPGVTGLAQIKGLRGDTSIQARIDEDINYIENWTFWSDIRILLLTPFCAINRHEKYAANDEREKVKQAERARRPKKAEEDEDEHE
ncbi:MAG: exopolysaccharide biosynthesis polyprenyl glycosylphosphotransferase [Clostridia bacterium]|nr:exopolysaccharide biosynthesis polyprenyl glycosylphosphotransferase [Clostridia bacterium]